MAEMLIDRLASEAKQAGFFTGVCTIPGSAPPSAIDGAKKYLRVVEADLLRSEAEKQSHPLPQVEAIRTEFFATDWEQRDDIKAIAYRWMREKHPRYAELLQSEETEIDQGLSTVAIVACWQKED